MGADIRRHQGHPDGHLGHSGEDWDGWKGGEGGDQPLSWQWWAGDAMMADVERGSRSWGHSRYYD